MEYIDAVLYGILGGLLLLSSVAGIIFLVEIITKV